MSKSRKLSPMSKRTEQQFESIIEDALTEANSIDCPPEEYRAELRNWIDRIRVEIQASESTS